jgi:hypothetical protein
MSLKFTINDPVEVPGPVREYYKKTNDGKYSLDVEAHPDAGKVAEFRNRNVALLKEVDELRPLKANAAQYEGLDPDAARAALANAADMAAKLARFEGVDPEEYRTLKARPDSTKLAQELEANLAAEKAAHAATQMKHIVTAEFLRVGGRTSAIDFMTTEAAKVFAMDGGKLTTKEFSASNPSEPISLAEWMSKQINVADFAFQPSRGGGATPSTTKFGARPNQKILNNPTPQQLGENARDIAAGRLKVEYSNS